MTTQTQNGSKPWLWLAGAVGTAAGIAALAYSRRPRTRWEKARAQVVRRAANAGKEMKPWLSAAAGVAAGCAAEAYRFKSLIPRVRKITA